MPPTAHAPSTSHGKVASAAGKYERSRIRRARGPGGNHCPIAPHGCEQELDRLRGARDRVRAEQEQHGAERGTGPAEQRRKPDDGRRDREHPERDRERVRQIVTLQDAEPRLQ